MSNSDFLKLGAIFVIAIVLFKLLSQYNLISPETYSTVPMQQPQMMPMMATPSPAAAGVIPTDSPAQAGTYMGNTECYPKDTLGADDLLPKDNNSQWAKVNPATGDIAGQNFLSAGYAFGVDTIGSNNRNQSYDLRGDAAPAPMVAVSPWMQSTIGPDRYHRTFEIGGNC